MSQTMIARARSAATGLRNRLIHLLDGHEFPEMQTWMGSVRLSGLWFLFLVVCALMPFYVLLRLPLRRGGWRFLAVFLAVVVLAAIGVGIMVLAVALSGMAGAK